MSGLEYANGGPSVDAIRSLCRAAGVTLAEFADDAEMGGLAAAIRRTAGKAHRRRNDPRRRRVELLRRRLSP